MKVLVALVLAGALSAPVAAEDGKADLKKLQGTWKATSLKYNGKDHSVEGDKAIYMVFKDDVATVRASEAVKKEYAKIRVKLDTSTMPKILDITVVGGSQKDTVMEGIYKFDRDKLVICARILGKDRPTRFESPEGESIVLLEMEREKE
jgi:uncharacterized protein (TIGR03067 family)